MGNRKETLPLAYTVSLECALKDEEYTEARYREAQERLVTAAIRHRSHSLCILLLGQANARATSDGDMERDLLGAAALLGIRYFFEAVVAEGPRHWRTEAELHNVLRGSTMLTLAAEGGHHNAVAEILRRQIELGTFNVRESIDTAKLAIREIILTSSTCSTSMVHPVFPAMIIINNQPG